MRSKPSGGRDTPRKSSIVIDTGVLVSAFAFGGTPREAVRKAVSQSRICISHALLKEYRDVPSALASKGKITVEQFNALIAGIAAVVATASMVRPRKRVRICRDASDDMLLECCLAAEAEHLVTGDKDLLSLTNLPFPLKIVTPKDYVQQTRVRMT